jgi:hypothetical protein
MTVEETKKLGVAVGPRKGNTGGSKSSVSSGSGSGHGDSSSTNSSSAGGSSAGGSSASGSSGASSAGGSTGVSSGGTDGGASSSSVSTASLTASSGEAHVMQGTAPGAIAAEVTVTASCPKTNFTGPEYSNICKHDNTTNLQVSQGTRMHPSQPGKKACDVSCTDGECGRQPFESNCMVGVLPLKY